MTSMEMPLNAVEESWIRRNLERILSKAVIEPRLVEAAVRFIDDALDDSKRRETRLHLLNPSLRVSIAFEMFHLSVGRLLWPDTTLLIGVNDAGDAELIVPMAGLKIPVEDGVEVLSVLVRPVSVVLPIIRVEAFQAGELAGEALDDGEILVDWMRKRVTMDMLNAAADITQKD